MLVEIITIGDELLIGQVVDTNSAWMSQQLNFAGFKVKQITSVSDDEQHIINALDEAAKRADVILITGGLGPTKDDITKNTLCKYFNTSLVFNEEAFKNLEQLFKMRGREVTPTNRKQAEVPVNCEVLQNKNGTAPGMWFEHEEKVFVSMPGVPYEMKSMMSDAVIPRLKGKFETPYIVHKTILTQGVGESFLSDIISDWEDSLPSHMKLAYLPSAGMVRLRLTAMSADADLEKQVEEQVKNVLPLIEKYVYGFDDDTLQSVVAKLLHQKKQTLSLAESCTGGYISHLITSLPGSSAYYKGSVIAYAYEIKEEFLNVSKFVLETKGAVSEEVVLQMASQVKANFKTDYAISVSGIAGPDGGTPDKPVGTVWIAIATPEKTFAKRFQFGTHRMRNIEVTAYTALNMLRKELLADNI
ncbi:MAG: competence/damage-inducible protein A [Bacteroidia bacterium]